MTAAELDPYLKIIGVATLVVYVGMRVWVELQTYRLRRKTKDLLTRLGKEPNYDRYPFDYNPLHNILIDLMVIVAIVLGFML